MVRSTAVSVALALASACAEASSVSTFTATSAEARLRVEYLKNRELEHKHGMERLTSNMTTSSALQIVVPNAKPELQSFIQTSIGNNKKTHLRSGVLLAGAQSDSKADSAGLQRAVAMLNEMIEESQEKYDLEVEKCCAYDLYQSGLMEDARQAIAKFNAEAAEARACMAEQSGYITEYLPIISTTKRDLRAHIKQCKKDIKELEDLLKIVNFDISIMDDILSIIGTCDEEIDYTTTPMPAEFIQVSQKPAFLMERCEAQGEDGSSCSFFQFSHGPVQNALSQLKSDKARELIQDNLNEMHERELGASNTTEDQAPMEQVRWSMAWSDTTMDGQEPVDHGESGFNTQFERSEHKLLKIRCPDCEPEFNELYYKRISPIGEFNAYKMVTESWGDTGNVLHTDYEMFTKESDAINGQNALKTFDAAAFSTNGKGKVVYIDPPADWSPEKLPKRTVLRGRPCKKFMTVNKRSGKCTPSPPNCLKMKERFEYIRAGMMDTKADLEDQLAETNHHCDTEEKNMVDQITQFQTKLGDAQNKLAVCTATANYNDGQSRLKSIELESLMADYAKMTKECHGNYALHEGDICAVKKIRTELKKVRNPTGQTFFIDCVVGEWVPGECSTTCGEFGMMKMERKILTPPVFGAKCPVLIAQEECNRKDCPIDCKMEEWAGWSGCTAKCGGGIMERTRAITQEPLHGGEPCGETSESAQCNIQDCDKDCELYDWTPWTECSKVCNGGHLVHYRRIEHKAIGNGECPRWWDSRRLGITECNMFACEASLKCASTLDVVLVIDGSGSLGPSGWEASKKAGAMLARAFGGSNTGTGDDATGPVMISVLLFSYYSEVKKHFTYDAEAAATTIENMQWPRSLTYTSAALNLAKDELQMGRSDAQSIVIVITDGRPMSNRNTRVAAKWLRKAARLMFVPVTQWAPLANIKNWVSFPREENIVQVNSFGDLESPVIIDKIIADACPEILTTTTTTTTVAE